MRCQVHTATCRTYRHRIPAQIIAAAGAAEPERAGPARRQQQQADVEQLDVDDLQFAAAAEHSHQLSSAPAQTPVEASPNIRRQAPAAADRPEEQQQRQQQQQQLQISSVALGNIQSRRSTRIANRRAREGSDAFLSQCMHTTSFPNFVSVCYTFQPRLGVS